MEEFYLRSHSDVTFLLDGEEYFYFPFGSEGIFVGKNPELGERYETLEEVQANWKINGKPMSEWVEKIEYT